MATANNTPLSLLLQHNIIANDLPTTNDDGEFNIPHARQEVKVACNVSD
jgi:hypothetical protein